jgi:hypothetical protein
MGLCWQAGRQARYRQTGLLLLASTTTTGTNTHYWRNPSATAEVYDRGVTTGNGTGSARKRVCQPGGVFLERSLAVGVAVSVGLGNRSMGMGMAMRSWIMDYARSPDGRRRMIITRGGRRGTGRVSQRSPVRTLLAQSSLVWGFAVLFCF